MALCTCPLGAEISDVYLNDCPEDLGQIQKVLFQRVFASAGVKNSLTIGTNNPNVLATWTTLLASATATKVVQSPFLSNPVTEVGAPRTYGGGNATIGGIEEIVGREPTTFTAQFLRTNQRTIQDIKKMQCEVLGVYLINEFGQIIGISDDIVTPTIFYPIPIRSLFISDKHLGGIEDPDMNNFQFTVLPNWSDDIHIVTPTNFDALTALVTP